MIIGFHEVDSGVNVDPTDASDIGEKVGVEELRRKIAEAAAGLPQMGEMFSTKWKAARGSGKHNFVNRPDPARPTRRQMLERKTDSMTQGRVVSRPACRVSNQPAHRSSHPACHPQTEPWQRRKTRSPKRSREKQPPATIEPRRRPMAP